MVHLSLDLRIIDLDWDSSNPSHLGSSLVTQSTPGGGFDGLDVEMQTD